MSLLFHSYFQQNTFLKYIFSYVFRYKIIFVFSFQKKAQFQAHVTVVSLKICNDFQIILPNEFSNKRPDGHNINIIIKVPLH